MKAAKAAATVLSNMFQYKKLHKDYKNVRKLSLAMSRFSKKICLLTPRLDFIVKLNTQTKTNYTHRIFQYKTYFVLETLR